MKKDQQIIAIAGEMGSGKDTIGEILQQEYGYEIKKFAAKVKQCCSLILGIPIEDFEKREVKDSTLGKEWDRWKITSQHGTYYFKSEKDALHSHGGNYTPKRISLTVRQFIQIFATEAVQERLHSATWANALFSEYTPNSKWVITDLRLPEEEDKVKEEGGKVILVRRPLYLRYPEIVKSYKKGLGLTIQNRDLFIDWLLRHPSGSKENNLGKAMSHFSETNVSRVEADYIIDNDGSLEKLKKQIKNIVE